MPSKLCKLNLFKTKHFKESTKKDLHSHLVPLLTILDQNHRMSEMAAQGRKVNLVINMDNKNATGPHQSMRGNQYAARPRSASNGN